MTAYLRSVVRIVVQRCWLDVAKIFEALYYPRHLHENTRRILPNATPSKQQRDGPRTEPLYEERRHTGWLWPWRGRL